MSGWRDLRAVIAKEADAAAVRRAGAAEWAKARTVEDLCELTARWCEGSLRYHPNGHSEGPEPETLLMARELAALNRAGLLTLNSQAGERHDRGEWESWVVALTDRATAEQVQRSAPAHVRVSVYGPTLSWRERLLPFKPLPEGAEDVVWCHMSGSDRAAEFGGLDDVLHEEVARMWQVTVRDTRPGVNDMWGWLVESVESAPRPPADPTARSTIPRPTEGQTVSDRTRRMNDLMRQANDAYGSGDRVAAIRTEKDKRFFDLRESGYKGPIDQDGYAVTDMNAWLAKHGIEDRYVECSEGCGRQTASASGRCWPCTDAQTPTPAPPPRSTPTPTAAHAAPSGGTTMSVLEVKQSLGNISEGLPLGPLQQALADVEEKQAQLAQVAEGSSDPGLADAQAVLAQVQQTIIEALQVTKGAQDQIEQYQGRI